MLQRNMQKKVSRCHHYYGKNTAIRVYFNGFLIHFTVQRFLPSARAFPHFDEGAPNLLVVPRGKSAVIFFFFIFIHLLGGVTLFGIVCLIYSDRPAAPHGAIPVHAH